MKYEVFNLGLHWPTSDPFLFCAHHLDVYPPANEHLGPKDDLSGRILGQDFSLMDGYRMYHGDIVPGFPVHPHRGFETITIVRSGYVDHADSLGSGGRYSTGDVQWMTAGKGILHSEMFPLLDQQNKNTTELLQIWLNLPSDKKLVDPEYKMFWNEQIPQIKLDSEKVNVDIIAGRFQGVSALAPPQHSWAADAANDIQIYIIEFSEKGGSIDLPKVETENSHRSLYFYSGSEYVVTSDDDERFKAGTGVNDKTGQAITIKTDSKGIVLLMQGKAIQQPVVQHGPFVMNSPGEIKQAIIEYQNGAFGQWNWPREDMVHGAEAKRFSQPLNGEIEEP